MSILRVLLAALMAATSAVPACTETAHSDTASAELLIVAGSDHAALLAQDTPFNVRLQLHSSLRLGVGALWPNGLEFSGGLSVARALPTSAAVGYSYAGWTGRAIWTSIGITRAGRLPDGMARGVRLAFHGVLAGYDETYLLAFFPAIEIVPSLRIPISGGVTASLEVPVGWQLRRDLGIAVGKTAVVTGAPYIGVSAGITLSVSSATR